MKKNSSDRRGPQDSAPQHLQPDKVGWIRKFCKKGIFREIWKNRFVVLRGDQLFICEKEVKDLSRADELLDLSDYERCEEIRKNKSRSKKNHSKFKLQRCNTPGTMVPNLIFLAVSPEEKECWINVLNAAITRAQNKILDEVMVEDAQLSHLTRDRVKIPHNRRLPTRGHLLTVASTSTSDGMLTLDLIQEEDHLSPNCPRSQTDGAISARAAEAAGKSQSLPRQVAVVWERAPPPPPPQPGKPLTTAEKNHCASMDQILTHSETKATKSRATPPTSSAPIDRLHDLIGQKLEKTEQLLKEVKEAKGAKEAKEVKEAKEAKGGDGEAGKLKGKESAEMRTEAQRLLKEAAAAWTQAQEVLEEVKELRVLYQQLDPNSSNCTKQNPM
ncbi:pleckstrin homology domain-containing family O member 1b [Scomber scombrus]|uniref:pleckstrin homology domain-containing family O member 1b n=1 Tax=Scomber scombrus TaxID=13677 RepID=UPI002DDB6AC5|nr:pleckstrin homology domain-containing family O member 1b [Scomber scombrus]